MLTGMRGEQPGRPQLVGITQLLGVPVRQRHPPGLRLGRDEAIASCTRSIIPVPRSPPSSAARSRQRVTVCCLTPIVCATA